MKCIAWLFGYMTAEQAKAEGFTHHGSFLGMPAWIGDVDSEGPMVTAKFGLLDRLLPYWAELFNALMPDSSGFPIKVKRKIE